MEDLLNQIYRFLSSARKYNRALHNRHYRAVLSGREKAEDKVIALLYNVANTQSQPDIDKLSCFFKKIHKNRKYLRSFNRFVKWISNGGTPCYCNLYKGLKKQPGWGEKTSALFAKQIFQLHNGKYVKELNIWDDVPRSISKNDRLLLPVDAVIISLFRNIGRGCYSFGPINRLLARHYSGEEIEVWDDLWFWGFISQRGSGENRDLEWNPQKYWMLEHSDKKSAQIKAIKQKSEEFIKLIKDIAQN